MDDALAKRGRSLEEAFFLERDAKLIAERKKLEVMHKTKEVLSHVSGIRDEQILQKLVENDISPAILVSLTLLPLVEVAWADGELSEAERKAVMEEAARQGIKPGESNHVVLETWLSKKPSAQLIAAWTHYIQGLKGVLAKQQLDELKNQLFARAQKVASASGGVMGIGKVSAEEKAVIKKMEEAFK